MSVVLDNPSFAAAPSQPPSTQFVACKVATMWSRSTAGMAGAINGNGQIAGTSTLTTPPTGGRAVLWDTGGITNITPALGQGETSSANGINDTDEIVGTMNSTPFIWRDASSPPWEISAAAVPALPSTSTTPARPSDRRGAN